MHVWFYFFNYQYSYHHYSLLDNTGLVTILAWLKLHSVPAYQSWLAGVMRTYVSAASLLDLSEGWRARSLTLLLAVYA